MPVALSPEGYVTTNHLIAWRILLAATVGLILFGLVLILMPTLTVHAFSLLVYSSTDHLNSFGTDALGYITLVHAVLGAVMIGWGVLFFFLTLGPIRRGSRDALQWFLVSLAAWYLPDTAVSLITGFWQNAVLNTVFGVLFAVPIFVLLRYNADDNTQ